MKKEIPPAAIIAAVVVVVALIGVVAYKTFGGDPAANHTTPEQAKAMSAVRGRVMAPGVHRDAQGHFVDANGQPVNLSPAQLSR